MPPKLPAFLTLAFERLTLSPPPSNCYHQSGCTLKEAAILSSVLSKSSVPMVHSGAAIAHLAGMDYTGPHSLFIRVLLDKKYALPYKVVDALVFHFIRLANDKKNGLKGEGGKLPVLWHQSLLVFAQRCVSLPL